MKKLCFGTLFKILYEARECRISPKVTNDSLCKALFSVFEDDFNDYGIDSGHLKSGHDNVPLALQDAAREMSFEEADSNFQHFVVPLIKDDMKEAIVRSIKDILKDDTSISNDTIIGYIDGYQKDRIINKSTFSFSAIMVSILYYVVTKVNNCACKEYIKLFDKDFVKSRLKDNRPIYFEDSQSTAFLPLDNTLCDPTFNCIFKNIHSEVCSETINSVSIAIYSTNINNRKINFRNAKQFIMDNLTSYVMSREQINRMNKVGRLATAGVRSMQKFIEMGNRSKESLLGEILLYVFMEQVLGAPKLLSKIEIDDIAGRSKSDGVYYFCFERRGIPYNRLLFGASNIYGDLKVAVDIVFEKIHKIEQNSDEEFLIVDNTRYQNILPEGMNQYLKEVMLPSKSSANSNSPDMAFGCFLGYTVHVTSHTLDNIQYEENLKKQMKDDIDSIIPYIKNKIDIMRLSNYEFYFYVVPFNDATNERISLIEEMIGGK